MKSPKNIICIKSILMFLIILVIHVNAQSSSIYISSVPIFMGKIPIGSSSDRNITILNQTINTINIGSISIIGESAAKFVISNNPNSLTLSALENLLLNIIYTPTSASQDVAILQIQTGTETVTDSLIGYGSISVNGIPTFERVFGQEAEEEDVNANLLTQTADGGYIVVGSSRYQYETKDDAYIIKTDKNGREEWTKLIGGSSDDAGIDVIALNDGSSVVVGETQSFEQGDPQSIYLFKIDPQGNLIWQKYFGGPYEDQARRIILASDGGFIIAGSTKTSNLGSTDAYVIKIDADGILLWSRSYGGQYGEEAVDITLTSDGGYIFVGSYQESLNPDVYIVKIDALGNELWSKTFSTPSPDEGKAICSTSDGGYIIAGYTTGENARDGYLLKINADGEQQWSRSYGGPHSDYFSGVVQTPDGGYLCTGAINQYFSQEFIYNNLWLVKTDSDGNIIEENQYGGDLDDFANGIITTMDGGYIISGRTESFGDRLQVYLLGVNANGNITEVNESNSITIPAKFSLSQNYPNPFNPSTLIEFDVAESYSHYVQLKVYDILGKEITTLVDGNLLPGHYKLNFNTNSVTNQKLSSGIYFYRLTCGNSFITKKMILLK